MNHSYTPENLLEYLYKETDPVRTREIELALQSDWTLREKLAVLQTARERLDRLVESPRTEIILNILRAAAPEKVSVQA
jgi:hypothetical protein